MGVKNYDGDRRVKDILINALLVQQIGKRALPNESPSYRLKQVALMHFILDFHDRGEALTLATLMAATGLTRGGLEEILTLLVKRGLLTETMGLNAIGRGRARQFALSSFIFDSLEPFLGKIEDGAHAPPPKR